MHLNQSIRFAPTMPQTPQTYDISPFSSGKNNNKYESFSWANFNPSNFFHNKNNWQQTKNFWCENKEIIILLHKNQPQSTVHLQQCPIILKFEYNLGQGGCTQNLPQKENIALFLALTLIKLTYRQHRASTNYNHRFQCSHQSPVPICRG